MEHAASVGREVAIFLKAESGKRPQGNLSHRKSVHFRVKAPVTRCSPLSPGREGFPHLVPRFQPFSPD